MKVEAARRLARRRIRRKITRLEALGMQRAAKYWRDRLDEIG